MKRTEREAAERRAREHLRTRGYLLFRSRSPSRVDFVALAKGRPVLLVRVNARPSDRVQLLLLAHSARARVLFVTARRGRALETEYAA